MKNNSYKILKKDIFKYGINGALLLAELRLKEKQWVEVGVLENNNEFFVTLQDLSNTTGLGVNTIKRLLPTLKNKISYEVRKDRMTKHTVSQLTYYIKIHQKPSGLVRIEKPSYKGEIDEKVDDNGYHFLLNPISTENIKHLVKLMENGWLPNDISKNHTLGKIHTIYQIEAVYNVFYLK